MTLRTLILSVLLLAGCRSALPAQEIRTVDGQKFIAHTVGKGQTLYAISKHYAVPAEAIIAANPSASTALSIGQVLLVPVKAQVKKELKSAPALMEGELAHTVKKKETLFGIARKYGVAEEELTKRNPALVNGVKEGMVVVVPINKVTTAPASQIAPATDDGDRMHLVQPGETLYALSQRYAVAEDLIRTANAGLPQGLKAGTYLRIPAAITSPGPVETLAAPPSTSVHKVALLLPFSIAANDSLHHAQPDHKGFYSVTDAAVQFYAGVRMAIDSLEAQGLRADVTVMDVGEHTAAWTAALHDPKLREAELCIGPFHRGAIESLKRQAPQAHIVCPVPQSNKVLLGNPNVSKVLSGRPDQVQQLARHVAWHHVRDNIILCMPDIPAEKELQQQMLRALQAALADLPNRKHDSVAVARCGKRDIAAALTRLSASHVNAVVVPSEDVEFVTALIGKLGEVLKDKRIVLYGLNSWTELNTVEVTDLVALGTCVPASSWIDRDDPAVQAFTRAYRERYQNDPGDYAFLGFDVGYFYLTALKEHGSAFPAHFAEVVTRPLHMAFKLQKAGEENGYRNENAVILQFKPEGLRKAL